MEKRAWIRSTLIAVMSVAGLSPAGLAGEKFDVSAQVGATVDAATDDAETPEVAGVAGLRASTLNSVGLPFYGGIANLQYRLGPDVSAGDLRVTGRLGLKVPTTPKILGCKPAAALAVSGQVSYAERQIDFQQDGTGVAEFGAMCDWKKAALFLAVPMGGTTDDITDMSSLRFTTGVVGQMEGKRLGGSFSWLEEIPTGEMDAGGRTLGIDVNVKIKKRFRIGLAATSEFNSKPSGIEDFTDPANITTVTGRVGIGI